MNNTLRYFNQLQADLQAIRRPYNEALAITKTIREMVAPQINLRELTRSHREAMEQIQRNLSFIHTLRYTRTIEGERCSEETSEKPESKEDTRLLFGDIY